MVNVWVPKGASTYRMLGTEGWWSDFEKKKVIGPQDVSSTSIIRLATEGYPEDREDGWAGQRS